MPEIFEEQLARLRRLDAFSQWSQEHADALAELLRRWDRICGVADALTQDAGLTLTYRGDSIAPHGDSA